MNPLHHHRLVGRVFLSLLLAFSFGRMDLVAQTNAASPALTVMTYNLRYASSTPPNAWPQRRPLVREVILAHAPDVIGTQEGVYPQLLDVAADLPDYEWIGLGRDGGSRGEFMAVFYRQARLEPLAFDHFWLSDTPEVMGSKSWAKLARMVTWVKFRDRQTKQEFILFNTHFDHEAQKARENSAELIKQRVAKLDAKLPVLLIGDFNANAGANRAHDILTADKFFTDAWDVAAQRIGEDLNTFNGFKGVQHDSERIDWILFHGPAQVEQIKIDPFQREGQFPSDHFPLVAKLRLSSAK